MRKLKVTREKYVKGPKDFTSILYDDFFWVSLYKQSKYNIIFDIDEVKDLVQWCLKNCSGQFSWGYKYEDKKDYRIFRYGFIFQISEDAMAFKLRWV